MNTLVKKLTQRSLALFCLFVVSACIGTPDGIEPVKNFDADKYMGTWYEIARIENRFERGLENITANYSLNDNGTVTVLNRGFSVDKQEWIDASGKAKFVGPTDQGFLKVSFFGPFYGSYIVFEMDDQSEEYAFVASHNRSYLWFLSRTPRVNSELKVHFQESIEELNFDTSNIVWVTHK